MLVRSSVFYHTVGCYKEPYREDHLIEAEEQIEDMNKRMQSQWSASGILEAPLDKVWEKLLDTFPMLSSQERSELERAGSPDVLKMSAGKHGEGRIHLEVDKNRHQVAVQGEWWYRGVYTLTPHTRGSLLVYQVYNVAPGVGWWLAQLFQGPEHARKMDAQLQALLRTIGNQLGCAAEMQRLVSH